MSISAAGLSPLGLPDRAPWFAYLALCADGSIYCGSTTDPGRRMREHNGKVPGRGAAYTKARRPVVLVHAFPHPHRASAQSHEARLKRMSRKKKLRTVAEARGWL